jgi:hypothetical protein
VVHKIGHVAIVALVVTFLNGPAPYAMDSPFDGKWAGWRTEGPCTLHIYANVTNNSLEGEATVDERIGGTTHNWEHKLKLNGTIFPDRDGGSGMLVGHFEYIGIIKGNFGKLSGMFRHDAFNHSVYADVRVANHCGGAGVRLDRVQN